MDENLDARRGAYAELKGAKNVGVVGGGKMGSEGGGELPTDAVCGKASESISDGDGTDFGLALTEADERAAGEVGVH